jgi:chloramphenicol 3-O-phosphotransferase
LNAPQAPGKLLLFGGPAGAGKSTLAAAWCRTRPLAAHVEIDAIREFLISGFSDPQTITDSRDLEYRLEVTAACTLARTFIAAGCDVAIDDVLEPDAFERFWRPQLTGLTWKLVIVLPELNETLARSVRRQKWVRPDFTRVQHARCSEWPSELRIDSTGLTVDESLELVLDRFRADL